jgi:RecA-family ATPase
MPKDKGRPSRGEILRGYSGEDRILSSHEIDMNLKEERKGLFNLKSNIPSLDREVEGFRDGELIVISGPTKHGKTLLAQTLTAAFTKQQEFPLWFSFEVPARQFLECFPELPLFYMPQKLKAHVFTWLEDRIDEAFLKYRTRAVFIDHLHYLVDLARLKNPSIEIGQIIRQLKNLAVDRGFIIFLLCHTTKGKSEQNLSYESIRDSSFISQESDCCIMIKRTPDVAKDASSLRIEFHRRTGVLEKVVELEKINGYLRERSSRDED